MADILLIHGAAHGAWCWRAVVPLLQGMGHHARAIDLPGHGEDQTSIRNVTLQAYARAIVDACDGPTVLVGHSMGGYAITAAAAMDPSIVSRLIYLCAYVPQQGVTLSQMRKQAPRQPLLQAVMMSGDGQSFTIDPQKAQALFYHDCPADDVSFALARLCPQAVEPSQVTVDLTPEQRALPRRYIRCLDDRTIPPEYQITMTEDWPVEHVQDMTCSHSPFFADPQGLAGAIARAMED